MTRPSEHVATIVAEAHQERLVRFDFEARVRVFVTQSDIEEDHQTRAVLKIGLAPEDVIAHLRVIAQAIAEERLEAFSDAHGDSITASIGPKNKTTDTVDWHAIASPEPEDDYNIER